MKKQLGQYFTTSSILQEKVFNLIKNKPDIILEPSSGRGDLVMYINKVNLENNKKLITFDCIEIDEKIDFLFTEFTNVNLIIHDFLEYNFNEKKYKTIIGNPPYVKRKGKCNLYMSFIDKCIDLLEDEGELIFIIPSDFFETTSSKNINKKLMENGIITDIFKPESEKLFIGASVDVVIFRYLKTFNNGVQFVPRIYPHPLADTGSETTGFATPRTTLQGAEPKSGGTNGERDFVTERSSVRESVNSVCPISSLLGRPYRGRSPSPVEQTGTALGNGVHTGSEALNFATEPRAGGTSEALEEALNLIKLIY